MNQLEALVPKRIRGARLVQSDRDIVSLVASIGPKVRQVDLNASSNLIWSQCDGSKSVEQLVAELINSFSDVSKETIRRDVLSALVELVNQGFLSFDKSGDVPSTLTRHLDTAKKEVARLDLIEARIVATPVDVNHQGKKLTIAMATYDDYDGVYFTVQALRLYHPEILNDIEVLIIDNNPLGAAGSALRKLSQHIPNLRYVPEVLKTGTSIRDLAFDLASSEVVVCLDCHIMLEPCSLAKLIDYFAKNSVSRDLIQGPLLNERLAGVSTHFKDEWSSGMYGVWGSDPRGSSSDSEPFEIPMQGLGLFACRKDAWPGFNPLFRGFGGEEGYIHEKFRQAGGRVLCLPFLRWLHRFDRPLGVPYPIHWEDRIRNYLVGFTELGLSTSGIKNHFREHISSEFVDESILKFEQEFGFRP